MDFIGITNICRCCLSTTGNFISIFESHHNYYLPKVIDVCIGLLIQQQDGLPEILCEQCLTKLVDCYEMRLLFLRSNAQLKEQLLRLRQSEQELLIELSTTVAKCAEVATTAAAESMAALPFGDVVAEDNVPPTDDLLTVEKMLDSAPIIAWDSEINMHIEQLQHNPEQLSPNIGDCLDELVIEKYEHLQKGNDDWNLGDHYRCNEPVTETAKPDGIGNELGSSKDDNPFREEDEFSPLSDADLSNDSDDYGTQNEAIATALCTKTPVPCPICGKMLSNDISLKRHINYHKLAKSQCPLCSRKFTHKSNLKRHLKSHKPPDDGFLCKQCRRKFHDGSALYEHMKLHKPPARNPEVAYTMTCEHCGMQTTSHAGFITHVISEHNVAREHIKPFCCDTCGLRFVSKQGMIRHRDAIHEHKRSARNRARNYLCTVCGKQFQTKLHLEAHLRSHEGQRPFGCDICGKRFCQKSGLSLHILTHTKRKPHSCGTCGKAFSQSSHLKEHLRIHDDRKPYVCMVCRHGFRVRSNLVAHMRVHSEKKAPFSCAQCDQQFSARSKLLGHITEQHVKGETLLEGC